MGKDEIVATLRAHARELQSLGLAKLYLFGSAARGATPPSDVDLAFEIVDRHPFSLLSQAGASLRLEELVGAPVDLVQRACLHPRIKHRVEAEMIEIF